MGIVGQGAGKNGGEQVSECIALLQHAAEDAPRLGRSVLQGRGSTVAVYAAHGNAKKCPYNQETLEAAHINTPMHTSSCGYGTYEVAKPVNSSNTMNSRLLMINGHFLPHLSAASPKVMAPTDRSISTSVMPHVMSALVLLNCLASWVTVSETVKKSKASRDHAQKATRKKRQLFQVSRRRILNGFGGISLDGRNEVSRVLTYCPTDVDGADICGR